MNFVNYLARLLDDFLGLSFFFGHEDIRVKIFLILLKSLLNDGDQFRTVLLRKTINRWKEFSNSLMVGFEHRVSLKTNLKNWVHLLDSNMHQVFQSNDLTQVPQLIMTQIKKFKMFEFLDFFGDVVDQIVGQVDFLEGFQVANGEKICKLITWKVEFC